MCTHLLWHLGLARKLVCTNFIVEHIEMQTIGRMQFLLEGRTFQNHIMILDEATRFKIQSPVTSLHISRAASVLINVFGQTHLHIKEGAPDKIICNIMEASIFV